MMGDRIKTLAYDGWSGFYDLAKAEQQPEIDEDDSAPGKGPRGNWGFDWNKLAGRAQHMLRLMEQIREKWDVNLVQTAHLAAEKLYVERISRDGIATQEGRQIGWKVDVPGQMQEQILRPYDEVWHLQIQPNAAGKPPRRQLFTQPHLWSGGAGASANFVGFPFEAKTRFGVQGPIEIAETGGYETIMRAKRKFTDFPKRILLVGIAGAGKTTLIESWPKPIVFVDLWGGCHAGEGVSTYTPRTLADVYKYLLKLKETGEVG